MDDIMNDSESLSQNIVECEIIAPVRILKKMVNSREVSTVVLLCVGFLFTLGYKSTQTQLEGYSSSIREKNGQSLRMALSTDNHSFEDKSHFHRIGRVGQELLDAHPPIPAVYMHLADLIDPVVDSSSIKRKKEKKEEPLTLGFRKKKEKKETKKKIEKNDESSKDLEEKETQKLPDLAIFWHLPRTGGSTITKILGECFGLTLGLSNPQIPFLDETSLRALRYQNSKLVNIDLSTVDGIQRAAQLNILHTTTSPSSRTPLTDVIATPNLYDTAKYLFNDSPPNFDLNRGGIPAQQRKGRLFTIFRHPVEREVSWFYHIKQLAENDKGSFHSDVHIYELSDWLVSDRFLDNIIVRSIVNKMERSYRVTAHDLHVAKEVIRRKCLILLIEEKASSLERLIQYFHWNRHQIGAGIAGRECEEKSLHWGWSNKNRHPIVHHDLSSESHEEDKEKNNDNWVLDQQSYERVELVNMFDMQLYEYAKFLFWEQGNEFFE